LAEAVGTGGGATAVDGIVGRSAAPGERSAAAGVVGVVGVVGALGALMSGLGAPPR
jgi:hypothetical protein